MRSPVAEAVVGPNPAVVAEIAAIGVAVATIAAAEAAGIGFVVARIALAVGIGRLNTATAGTAVADCSPAAAAADSLAVIVGLDSFVGTATALLDAEPEAPSPWLCPLQIAYQKKTWLTLMLWNVD